MQYTSGSMRNDECIIYIYNKDKLVNTWYKENSKWTLISIKGNDHHATAEQFLSHLIPAIMKEDYTVKVERKET
jgi:hypothetical protein